MQRGGARKSESGPHRAVINETGSPPGNTVFRPGRQLEPKFLVNKTAGILSGTAPPASKNWRALRNGRRVRLQTVKSLRGGEPFHLQSPAGVPIFSAKRGGGGPRIVE